MLRLWIRQDENRDVARYIRALTELQPTVLPPDE